MSNMTKIGGSNIKDNFNAKILAFLANNTIEYTRTIYLGQVMVNEDAGNLNRVKIRIPLIDDIFYKDVSKQEGDNSLPWCLPISSRFVSTPEANSIVIVLLADPKTPFFGRIYLDSVTDISATDLFQKLTPEEQSLSNWLNVQNAFEINIPTPLDEKGYNVKKNTKYKLGIRGKGKNKIELDETKISISQNYQDKNKETSIELTENLDIKSSDEINITSKKGRKKNYHPVFDSTLFDYLEKQNRMIQKIVTILNTIPAIAPIGGPCTAGPNSSQLITELTTLKGELKKLKQIGYSEKITIN